MRLRQHPAAASLAGAQPCLRPDWIGHGMKRIAVAALRCWEVDAINCLGCWLAWAPLAGINELWLADLFDIAYQRYSPQRAAIETEFDERSVFAVLRQHAVDWAEEGLQFKRLAGWEVVGQHTRIEEAKK